MKNGYIPPKDACFQCYHPPVFYYTSAKIGETLNAFGMEETVVRKTLQFLNFLYNVLTLVVVYLILRAMNLSSYSKIVAFTTVCILPRHIYMAAMHSNDNLCILLVALCCYLVLIAIDRKLAWQTVVLVGIIITLATFVKYTAFVLFPTILISMILIPIYIPQISVSRTITAVLFSLLPAILRIPVESGHHSDGKAATVPTGIRTAFRFDSGHHSGAIRPV
jgi:4-amino-4-deoxy-L-arabinose transferase-like glycosyltransferase